jgi:cell division topological specificity factor
MKWLKNIKNLFIQKGVTASLAKERLQIILQHERASSNDPEMLKNLQREIMKLVAKYVKVDEDQVIVELGQKGGCSVLELNVMFTQKAPARREDKAALDLG